MHYICYKLIYMSLSEMVFDPLQTRQNSGIKIMDENG